MNKRWGIKKCEPFNSRLSSAREKVKRIDEFLSGAENALSRDPGFGKKTGKNKLYALPMIQLEGVPEVVLYYIITETEILFVDLKIGNSTNPQRIFL